jgi:hypothetical protein
MKTVGGRSKTKPRGRPKLTRLSLSLRSNVHRDELMLWNYVSTAG